MNRCYLQIVVLLASIFVVGCSGNRIPAVAEQAMKNSTDFEVLSLEPDPRVGKADGHDFHGWTVLGKTTIEDSNTRAKLISRFKAGVAENNGTVAACFNPRHGIKVTHHDKTHEFVICFECYQVKWFIDGQNAEGFLITQSPQPMFDEILSQANVPLAKKAKK